jgi:isocitrate/isopropylmalate dehydrogenase
MSAALSLAVIEGDGIGPELVASSLAVLEACADRFGFAVRATRVAAGAAAWRATGERISAEGMAVVRAADATLKGPVGLPDARLPDGTEAGLLGGVLRTGLDTYACLRPIRLLPGAPSALRAAEGRIDYVIVRENTEGLYLSRGGGVATPDAAADQLLITRAGTRRVVRTAFELARRRHGAPADGRRRVTVVDKSNVLRSFALFRQVADEVAADYPDVELDHRYTDAAAHDLVARPEHFDVVVTENFVGDLLSDLGAATVGGLGMCPSANIGDDHAYFEPCHGSAPGLAGTGRANPTSQVQSLAMLLEHVGRVEAAAAVRDAVASCFRADPKLLAPDGALRSGIVDYTERLVRRIHEEGARP